MACAGITSSGGTRLTNWPAVQSPFFGSVAHFFVLLCQLQSLLSWSSWLKKLWNPAKFVKRFTDISFPKIGFCSFCFPLCWWLTFFVGTGFVAVHDDICCNEAVSPLHFESRASAWTTEASWSCWLLLWVHCVGDCLIKLYYDNGAACMWIALEV